jgi:hypothetical protein
MRGSEKEEKKRHNDKDNLFWHYLLSHHSINDAWRFTMQVREMVLPLTTWSSEGPTIFALGTAFITTEKTEGGRGERGGKEKSKQAMFFNVSKKVSTTLFTIQ